MGDKNNNQKHFAARRKLLALGASAPLLSLPKLGWAASSGRELSFSHTHTGERLKVTYFDKGDYLPDALAEINHLFRDFRTAEVMPVDLNLLDTVHAIWSHIDAPGSFEIISAYRSPKTNEMLRARSNGVAKKSFHMTGMAIDIRHTGVDTTQVRDIALRLNAGGVGYYAGSNFVHVDVGPQRSW